MTRYNDSVKDGGDPVTITRGLQVLSYREGVDAVVRYFGVETEISRAITDGIEEGII